ncbi:hypothetical protein WN943_011266 [Citrus x changshan-huyou]
MEEQRDPARSLSTDLVPASNDNLFDERTNAVKDSKFRRTMFRSPVPLKLLSERSSIDLSKVKYFQMDKLKEAAARIDRTLGATACEIKPDHMTSVFIAFDAVP